LAQLAAEGQRDHVLIEQLAQADPHVEAARHDVDHGVVDLHVERDVGMVLGELREDGLQEGLGSQPLGMDADRPRRLLVQVLGIGDGGLHLGQRREESRQQALSSFGGGHAAGGAVQQEDAEALLQILDGLAQGRARDAQPGRRPREAPLLDDGRQGLEFREVTPAHSLRSDGSASSFVTRRGGHASAEPTKVPDEGVPTKVSEDSYRGFVQQRARAMSTFPGPGHPETRR
jgi:hypothetical protein